MKGAGCQNPYPLGHTVKLKMFLDVLDCSMSQPQTRFRKKTIHSRPDIFHPKILLLSLAIKKFFGWLWTLRDKACLLHWKDKWSQFHFGFLPTSEEKDIITWLLSRSDQYRGRLHHLEIISTTLWPAETTSLPGLFPLAMAIQLSNSEIEKGPDDMQPLLFSLQPCCFTMELSQKHLLWMWEAAGSIPALFTASVCSNLKQIWSVCVTPYSFCINWTHSWNKHEAFHVFQRIYVKTSCKLCLSSKRWHVMHVLSFLFPLNQSDARPSGPADVHSSSSFLEGKLTTEVIEPSVF